MPAGFFFTRRHSHHSAVISKNSIMHRTGRPQASHDRIRQRSSCMGLPPPAPYMTESPCGRPVCDPLSIGLMTYLKSLSVPKVHRIRLSFKLQMDFPSKDRTVSSMSYPYQFLCFQFQKTVQVYRKPRRSPTRSKAKGMYRWPKPLIVAKVHGSWWPKPLAYPKYTQNQD